MRKRLTALVLAVTTLIVTAYTVPLAILVKNQADERARTTAERLVQDVARSLVPVAAVDGLVDLSVVDPATLPATVGLVSNDATVVGEAGFDVEFATWTAENGGSASQYLEDGTWQVSLPIIGREGTWAVVSATVAPEVLSAGVGRAWMYLAILGLVLVGVALLLADRIGRMLRQPVAELALAAQRLGSGDLDHKVERPEITELSVVADALNRMAPRLRNLLASEREALADLSHRLRTPLAALRLQAETIADSEDRLEVLGLVDRLQASVDRLIVDARAVDPDARCDLAAVARIHAEFWAVLAEEEDRSFSWAIPDEVLTVGVTAEELGDALDVLFGNVFSHTDRGVGFEVTVATSGQTAVLCMSDAGIGFADEAAALRRGASGGGSTGLGLDIARRVAERGGGGLRLGRSPLGGAEVCLDFSLV